MTKNITTLLNTLKKIPNGGEKTNTVKNQRNFLNHRKHKKIIIAVFHKMNRKVSIKA
jgi:hypothetical protein